MNADVQKAMLQGRKLDARLGLHIKKINVDYDDYVLLAQKGPQAFFILTNRKSLTKGYTKRNVSVHRICATELERDGVATCFGHLF